MPKFIDMTGQVFGQLTVLKRAHNVGSRTMWLCRCTCGVEKPIITHCLRSGIVISCGCFHNKKTGDIFRTHGMSQTKLYKVYTAMRQRCEIPHHPSYQDYGLRGITVCEEWRNDRTKFFDWALSNGYADNLSIDRINNDLGYSPDNCRWADTKVQSMNKRSTRLITVDGITKSLVDWLQIYPVTRRTFYERIENGWDEVTALTKPPRQVNQH